MNEQLKIALAALEEIAVWHDAADDDIGACDEPCAAIAAREALRAIKAPANAAPAAIALEPPAGKSTHMCWTTAAKELSAPDAAPSVAPEPTTIMWTICRMALMVNPSEAMIHQVKRLASASEGIAQQQLSALALRAEQAQSKPHVIARPVSPLAWQGSCSCPKCGEAQSTPYDASEICSKCALAAPSVAPEPAPVAYKVWHREAKHCFCLASELPTEFRSDTGEPDEYFGGKVQPLFAHPPRAPLTDEHPYTYTSTQATNCAGCGEYKHTPLRIDAMGGYVCLTCIDKKLGTLLGEFGYPPRAPLTEEFWLMLDTALDALKYHQEQTRPIELTRVTIAAVETFISAHGIGGK